MKFVCEKRASLLDKVSLMTCLTQNHFNFVGNAFTDKVAMSFSETLKENRKLCELDLSYNNFGEHGGLYLGAGLVSPTLYLYNIPYTCITI